MSAGRDALLSRPAAHFSLHVTVLLWGLTAILGKAIEVNAFALVFYRLALVTLLAAAVMVQRRDSFRVTTRGFARFALIGSFVAIHWWTFYACIKVAGVAVAVICLSTIPFFTALIEPVFFGRRVRASELIIGLLVVAGAVVLVRAETHASPFGLALGLGSALFSAAFGAWNGVVAKEETPARLTFFELGAAALLNALVFAVVPASFVAPWALGARNAGLLLVLAVFCTLLPWLLNVRVLRVLTPFTVAVAITLEPVYSVLLAYLVFPQSERLGLRFYLGAASLVALVLANALVKNRYRARSEGAAP